LVSFAQFRKDPFAGAVEACIVGKRKNIVRIVAMLSAADRARAERWLEDTFIWPCVADALTKTP
jgi:hypothetical protein